jgi:mRNA interferase RelE/StbE
MNIKFDKSFYKSLDKLRNPKASKDIEEIILKVQAASSIRQIPNLKKLQGFKLFFRIRIGEYRLGLELENHQTIRFITIAHRKDIYKYFP